MSMTCLPTHVRARGTNDTVWSSRARLQAVLWSIYLAGFALLAGAGCTASEGREGLGQVGAALETARDDEPRLIVVLGSSTAAGIGPRRGELAWVERYKSYLTQAHPAFELVNLASGGATTFEMQPSDYTPPANRPTPVVDRNVSHALDLGADAIVVNMPSNDQQNRFPLAEQLANYERVVARAAERGVPVWIATAQPRNFDDEAQRADLVRARDAIQARFGDRALDFWSSLARDDGRIVPMYDSGDGVHLNDAAHAVLAERVIAANLPAAIVAARP